ncbi:hypothetical protein COBT_003112, partial [Conglomerata obtusa]
MISLLALYLNVAKLATNPSQSSNVEQQTTNEDLKINAQISISYIINAQSFLSVEAKHKHDILISSLESSINMISVKCELSILKRFLALHLNLLKNCKVTKSIDFKNNDSTFAHCAKIFLAMY